MPPPLVLVSNNHFDRTENFMKRNISWRWPANSMLKYFRQGIRFPFSQLQIHLVCVCAELCLTLRPHGLWPTRLLCPWDFPGKNPGVGRHTLRQGIFPTQGSNLRLLHWQEDFDHFRYLPSTTWEAHRFTSGKEYSTLNKKTLD